jgi:organic radical activating enzyme
MPRKPDENYHEYRDRMITPVSNSFCAAKWYNATIWLGHGETTSCHHPSPHKIDLAEIAVNPSAIHNTPFKKSVRKLMLEGTRPDECSYCWKVEDIGRDNISDRVFKTVIYQDEDIKKIVEAPWDDNVNLRTLEIAFDRTCNFACSYCNATFSTSWTKDIKKYGPYQELVTRDAGGFRNDGTWADTYKDKGTNPYINAFWEWWPELSKELEELRVTGGEPLMSDDVWKLFDRFAEEDIGHIRLAINSNLGGKDALIDRLIEKSKGVKQLDIYTSCEAVGAQAEYIRDGLDFDKWKTNVERLLTEGNIRRLHVMLTINSLCLFSITQLMDQVIEWKHKHNRINGRMGMSFNILSMPSFMSPLVLPQHLRDMCRKQMIEWRDANQDEPAFEMHERDGFQRLIDYLEVVDAPEYESFDIKQCQQDLKRFYQQYDVRREKTIQVFPKPFLDWYNSIRTHKVINIQAIK